MSMSALRRRSLAALAALSTTFTLAVIAVAPPARATGVSSPTIAAQVLSALNYERTTHGLVALRMNTKLVSAAHKHNLAMAAANMLSHQVPGEATFTSRLTAAGYSWSYAAENVGWTYDMSANGAVRLHALMFHEVPPNDTHRLNILGVHYLDAGIDVLLDSRTGKLWLTEDFARPH